MMLDLFDILVSVFAYSLYGVIFVLSIVFTFWLESFRDIERRLMVYIIPAQATNPLEIEIQTFSEWLYAHHGIVGPMLIVLSLLDIKFSFELIRTLSMIRV